MPAKKNNARTKKAKTASKKTTVAAVAESSTVVETTQDTQVESTEQPTVSVAPVQKGGKSKRVKKSKVTQPVEDVTETELATVTETVTETQVGSGKRVRSFKVRLPGNESFEGRFTGLTPYQAANKALSKYYRETDKPKKNNPWAQGMKLGHGVKHDNLWVQPVKNNKGLAAAGIGFRR